MTTASNSAEIDSLRAQARVQVEEAVRLLPLEKRRAYAEAKEKVPHLCETELDPMKFLRFSDYNIWAAAEHLCLYWKHRKDLFQERAFLPMTLTGEGALTTQDAMSLWAGYPAILPRTTNGRRVVLIDRRRFHPEATPENRLRCLFYAAHKVAQCDGAQTDGVVVLVVVGAPRAKDVNQKFAARSFSMLRESFPIKHTSTQLLNLPTPPRKRYLLQDMLAAAVDRHLKVGIRPGLEISVHFEREPGEHLSHLLGIGLKREGIPAFLGGTWTFNHHSSWCEEQELRDRAKTSCTTKMRFSAVAAAAEAAAATSLVPTHMGGGTAAGLVSAPPPKDSQQYQRSRKREWNVIYSRRKRERRRQEETELREEHDQLAGEKDALLAENDRLEKLLLEAERLVASVGNGVG